MLVTIIIPIYNVEKYLNQCIESVVNQTYTNLEIILVDDGSIDNSAHIAEEWVKRDSRIKLIKRENGGLSAARNTGIDNAHGEWLSFVDSDDYISKDYIQKMLTAAQENNVKLVNCNYLEVDEQGNSLIASKLNSGIYNYKEFWNYYYNTGLLTTLIVAWSKLYHKDIFQEIRYKEGILNEDEEIINAIIHQAKNIVIINTPLYYYRVNRAGSIMNSINKGIRPTVYKILKNRTDDFIEKGLYSIASKCNEELLFMFMYDCTYEKNFNKERFFETIKYIKGINKILRKKGIGSTIKADIFLKFPYLVLILKRLKKNLLRGN